MINEKYYKEYAGEPAIKFEAGGDSLVIWEGYIYILMEDMYDQDLKILSDYYSSEDNDEWEINNLNSAITQFKLFDLDKVAKQDLTSVSKFLPDVVKEIINFLLKALEKKQKVSILKD